MRIADFDLYQELLKKQSGLTITPDKSYLLDSRLTPVAKKHGYNTIDSMTIALRGVPEPALIKDIVEAMTTNETSFFRDGRPFDLFEKTVLPYILEKNKASKSLRIWCAAASSGQEPYSLAIKIKENRHLMPGWRTEILATDISDDILALAEKAEYSQFEIQRGLPIQMLVEHFEQIEDHKWRLKDDLRKMVTFKNFNLLDSMSGFGPYDIIFCRNVLIYFDEATKKDVLERMVKTLNPEGFLFLGGAETVLGITDAFKLVEGQRGLYIPADSTHELERLKA